MGLCLVFTLMVGSALEFGTMEDDVLFLVRKF